MIAETVERVDTRDQQVVRIVPLGQRRPFFAETLLGVLAPPDGLRGSETKAFDPLAWYALGREMAETASLAS